MQKNVLKRPINVTFFLCGHEEQPCQISFSISSSISAKKLEAETFRLLLEPARTSDVAAQGPSKSRRIKNADGYFFPEQLSFSGRRPAKKQRLSVSKKTAMGLWSCHREPAVKGARTVTQAARD